MMRDSTARLVNATARVFLAKAIQMVEQMLDA
jgi:hypothetical protein